MLIYSTELTALPVGTLADFNERYGNSKRSMTAYHVQNGKK
jgi:hypothetical protein